LPSAAVALPARLAAALRLHDPAVVGRVREGRLLLDLLAVPDDEDAVLLEAVRRVSAATPEG
jgi:L-seryl-tRNA(Ser) seleniumtransferase